MTTATIVAICYSVAGTLLVTADRYTGAVHNDLLVIGVLVGAIALALTDPKLLSSAAPTAPATEPVAPPAPQFDLTPFLAAIEAKVAPLLEALSQVAASPALSPPAAPAATLATTAAAMTPTGDSTPPAPDERRPSSSTGDNTQNASGPEATHAHASPPAILATQHAPGWVPVGATLSEQAPSVTTNSAVPDAPAQPAAGQVDGAGQPAGTSQLPPAGPGGAGEAA